MEVIKFSRSAFERQIMESVIIQNRRDDRLLNSKAEYNRCAIPRLGLKMGRSEVKERKLKEEEDAEDKKEETLEKKIWELRRKRNKERGGNNLKGQPAKKRRKLDNSDEDILNPITTPSKDERNSDCTREGNIDIQNFTTPRRDENGGPDYSAQQGTK